MAHQNRSKLSAPLAIVAVIAAGAFFYALFLFSEPTQVTLTEDEGEQPPMALGLSSFQGQVANLVADEQRIQLDNLIVASVMSPSLFWFNLPDESSFLVRLELDILETGVSIEEGDVMTLTGRVHEVTEQLLNQWLSAGVLPNEESRAMAETVSQYILADDITLQVPEGMEEEADAGEQDTSGDDADG